MKPEEIYLLFLEEALELLPLIQAGLRKLSQDYKQLAINPEAVHQTITDIIHLLDALNLGSTQAREAHSQDEEISADVFNLEELQTLISNLYNLLANFLEQNSETKLVKLQELWQTYIRLKYALLKSLSQTSLGNFSILAKGELLFSLAKPQDNIAISAGLDSDLQSAIVDKDMVQSLVNLELILDSPDLFAQSTQLKHQAEIFSGLGELLELEDLIAIAESVNICIEDKPSATQLIGQRALACWEAVQTALSKNTNNYQVEDWHNYLFLVEDNQASISTDVTPEIEPDPVTQKTGERILKTEQFFMWLSGHNIFFLPANLVFAMIIPQAKQIKYLDNQQIFIWQEQNIPLYQLSELLNYNYLLPDDFRIHPSKLILVVKHNKNLIALEIGVEQPLVEPSLTLKFFDPSLNTPSYVCGCTLLGDERFKVVIDLQALLTQWFEQ